MADIVYHSVSDNHVYRLELDGARIQAGQTGVVVSGGGGTISTITLTLAELLQAVPNFQNERMLWAEIELLGVPVSTTVTPTITGLGAFAALTTINQKSRVL